ncbi:hypothetical protein D3C81_1800130 [compost metagenome]
MLKGKPTGCDTPVIAFNTITAHEILSPYRRVERVGSIFGPVPVRNRDGGVNRLKVIFELQQKRAVPWQE